MMVISQKVNFFENLRLKNKMKVQFHDYRRKTFTLNAIGIFAFKPIQNC